MLTNISMPSFALFVVHKCVTGYVFDGDVLIGQTTHCWDETFFESGGGGSNNMPPDGFPSGAGIAWPFGTNSMSALNKIGLCNTIYSATSTASYLGSIGSGVYANTVKGALSDITRYFGPGTRHMHIGSSMGGKIAWQHVKINWDEYRSAWSGVGSPNDSNGGAIDIFNAFIDDVNNNGVSAAGLNDGSNYCPQSVG